MTLPIADCRLPIAALRARSSFPRGRHDRSQIVRFLQQRRQLASGCDSRFTKQLEPQCGFVSLLLNCFDFSNEFRFASSAARCTIVRCHGGSASDNLLCDDSCGLICFGNRPRQFNNPQGKTFGALFQFKRVHRPKLQNQLAIANRQSPMFL